MKTVNEWKTEYGNSEHSNLNKNEKAGLESARKSVENNKMIIFPTDKSKKFSVDTVEGYKNDMMNHIEKYQIIDEKSVNRTVKKSNELSKSLVKIIGIGKNSNQLNRAVKNVHVHPQSELPVCSGLHKDHKTGRNIRPLVNGNIGPVKY